MPENQVQSFGEQTQADPLTLPRVSIGG